MQFEPTATSPLYHWWLDRLMYWQHHRPGMVMQRSWLRANWDAEVERVLAGLRKENTR